MGLSQAGSRKQKLFLFGFTHLLSFFFLPCYPGSFVCKCLSSSWWCQREQKYRCSVHHRCSVCDSADKMISESTAVFRSLHWPCSPNPHTFNHSSPQTVAGMWFGLRLLPSPESQQYAGSGQTAALQTTSCSEQPQVQNTACTFRQPPSYHIITAIQEGWASLQRQKTSQRKGRQTEGIMERFIGLSPLIPISPPKRQKQINL